MIHGRRVPEHRWEPAYALRRVDTWCNRPQLRCAPDSHPRRFLLDKATPLNVTKRGVAKNVTSDRHKSEPWLVSSASAARLSPSPRPWRALVRDLYHSASFRVGPEAIETFLKFEQPSSASGLPEGDNYETLPGWLDPIRVWSEALPESCTTWCGIQPPVPMTLPRNLFQFSISPCQVRERFCCGLRSTESPVRRFRRLPQPMSSRKPIHRCKAKDWRFARPT
jgi:hypothetical protein